jgi:hypothetical protein
MRAYRERWRERGLLRDPDRGAGRALGGLREGAAVLCSRSQRTSRRRSGCHRRCLASAGALAPEPRPGLPRQSRAAAEALAHPGLREEALGILRGLIERVAIHPAEDGLQIEIVGEIVKTVELSLDAKQAALPKGRPVRYRWLRGQDSNLRPSGYESCRSPFAALRKIAREYSKRLE